MDRRQFLTTAAATTAIAALPRVTFAQDLQDLKPKRVGLIGCGWYGKCDLLRLIQVAPVEVVSICDVDTQMRQGAAEIMLRGRNQASSLDSLATIARCSKRKISIFA